jgi:hypothetical protein
MPMKYAFPLHLEPQQSTACYALKRAEYPDGMGVVAVCRIENHHPGHAHSPTTLGSINAV